MQLITVDAIEKTVRLSLTASLSYCHETVLNKVYKKKQGYIAHEI